MKLLALWLWISDAATEFINGAISGFGPGSIVGGAAAAQTDTTNAQTISINAALGFLFTVGGNGAKRVVIWHDTHPVPNPFRSNEKADTPPPPPAA